MKLKQSFPAVLLKRHHGQFLIVCFSVVPTWGFLFCTPLWMPRWYQPQTAPWFLAVAKEDSHHPKQTNLAKTCPIDGHLGSSQPSLCETACGDSVSLSEVLWKAGYFVQSKSITGSWQDCSMVEHLPHNQGSEFEFPEKGKHVPAIFVFLPWEERQRQENASKFSSQLPQCLQWQKAKRSCP